jgi:Antitoxin Phd_YefM, type II toxin-antitoxin system
MISVGVREAKNQLSALLRDVRDGNEIEITRRSVPDDLDLPLPDDVIAAVES